MTKIKLQFILNTLYLLFFGSDTLEHATIKSWCKLALRLVRPTEVLSHFRVGLIGPNLENSEPTEPKTPAG